MTTPQKLQIVKTKLSRTDWRKLKGEDAQEVGSMTGVAYEWNVWSFFDSEHKGHQFYAARIQGYGPVHRGTEPPVTTWIVRFPDRDAAVAWRLIMGALVEETADSIQAEIS